jgi:hypothetical protein
MRAAAAPTTSRRRLAAGGALVVASVLSALAGSPGAATGAAHPGSRGSPIVAGTAFALTTAWGAHWTVQVSGYTPNAWRLIEPANTGNQAPPPGYQYAMVRYDLVYDGPGQFQPSFLPDGDLDVVEPSGTVDAYNTTQYVIVAPHPRSIDYMAARFGPGASVSFNVVYQVREGQARRLVGLSRNGTWFALR